VLRGNPRSNDVGRYSDIVISVSDGSHTTTASSFEVIVDASGSIVTNHAPTLSGNAPVSVKAGSNYYFQPTASDSDGDPLSFSVKNLPSWASFNASNGTITGTPGAEHVGITSGIQISVSDGTAIAYGQVFEIAVTTDVVVQSNSAPTLGGTPPTSIVAGNSYFFRPTASDANGDALSFSVANLPAWAGFNGTDGAITGTPTAVHVGNYANIRISVSDGIATTSGSTFSIEVRAGNQAPTLSGTPAASVNAGDSYRFQPTANDPDGDTLSFTIRSLPAWASFDANTGTLSGTPTDGDVGLYANIAISVSDGSLQTNGVAFSIEVTQVSLGSATLSWTAPTENMDGTPLTDLAGYKLYYGTSEGNYTKTISVDNPGIVTYVVDNLPRDTYYFVATAYNNSGVESPYSGVAVKVVN